MTAYETWTNDVLQKLLDALKANATLGNGTGLVKEYRIGVKAPGIHKAYPYVFLMPVRNVPTELQTDLREHELTVEAICGHREPGGGEVGDFDRGFSAINKIAGAVQDEVIAQREDAGGPLSATVKDITTGPVEYALAAEGNAILYEAAVSIVVLKEEK